MIPFYDVRDEDKFAEQDAMNGNEKRGTCQGCQKKEASEDYHPCPFLLEIEYDDTECNCCDDCEENCGDSI